MESFDDFKTNADYEQTDRSISNKDTAVQTSTGSPVGSAQPSIDDGTEGVSNRPPRSVSIWEAPAQDEDEDSSPSKVAPLFPQLTNDHLEYPKTSFPEHESDEDGSIDDDHGYATLPRRSSPSPSIFRRNQGAMVESSLYYIIGSDMLRKAYRILKISRMSEPGELDITEDDIVYTQKETQQIVNAVDEGNKASGGLKIKTHEFWGLLGFVRFTGAYYMVIAAKRSHVAVVGGHYIDKIDQTEMIHLATTAASKARSDKHVEESRLLGIFGTVDLSKGFYFSRSYDITRTLQHNIIKERQAIFEGYTQPQEPDLNDMFVWNHHLLLPARKALAKPFDWCLAVTHGYIDQSALSIYWGRVVYITIIARRSRFFAGARYLKRGANDLGYVANDVETEQIVSEMQTQSFHAPGPKLYTSPHYTSYVQHRGSIPLHWMQDPSGVSPKPDINLSVVDPFYAVAALHFDNLFERYGSPIMVVNLIKLRENHKRETKLGSEFLLAINYLNQFLPEDKKINYRAFDMSRAAKNKDRDVIGDLEEIADDVMLKTGFFHNGSDGESSAHLQRGVARTNCIDCLDRTNAAQFVIGKKALGYQLQALGVIEGTNIEYDTDAIVLFTNMYHDHGDTLAVQYGGSHLVNTMSTYRKINQWTSHSRDMVESLKRYYNNSFLDAQRQESYNLFLGNYTYRNGAPMLWDLSSDYYLHHTDPRSMFGMDRPSYRDWYRPEHLRDVEIPPSSWPRNMGERPVSAFDDYWDEYYRPLTLSSYRKIFAFKMHSNLTIINVNEETQDGRYDLSPFVVRRTKAETAHAKTLAAAAARKKAVKVIAPSEERGAAMENTSIDARLAADDKKANPQALSHWVDMQQPYHTMRTTKYTGIIKETPWERASRTPMVPAMPPANAAVYQIPREPTKQEKEAMMFEKLVADSLDPKVNERDEYEEYISHPSNIPLVTSTDTDFGKVPKEFVDYMARMQDSNTLMYNDALANLFDGQGEPYQPYMTVDQRAASAADEYQEYIDLGLQDDPLTVLDEDDMSKRYKKYRSWLTRGKSLFKQKHYLGGELV